MERIGASTEGVEHNTANQAMLDGCQKLGFKCETTAQNFKDPTAHAAGWTCFGDRYGNKQGTSATFLGDAAKNGARFVFECSVDRVLHESTAGGRRRATGIAARVGPNGIPLVVRARRCVVVSGGSLNSPCLLMRSGFENPNIGRHLRLHPVTTASGLFGSRPADEGAFACWRGPPMTTVCNECAPGPKGDGYGAKLEIPSAHPGLLSAGLPWMSGQQSKQLMLQVPKLCPIIILQRDHGEGRVLLDADGTGPRIQYTVSAADRTSMFQAMRAAYGILVAAGATQVFSLHSKVDTRCACAPGNDAYVVADWRRSLTIRPDEPAEAQLDAYIAKLEGLGMPSNAFFLVRQRPPRRRQTMCSAPPPQASAHQMVGSRRLGTGMAAAMAHGRDRRARTGWGPARTPPSSMRTGRRGSATACTCATLRHCPPPRGRTQW